MEMAGQKSPGPDGLPTAAYKCYGQVLLPELLGVLNLSAVEGELPSSMMDSTIVMIHKEGIDPFNTSSYRPISLLSTYIKILPKVLATRFNQIIQKHIHPDQSGFIQGRSTSTNKRCVYLNLQVPTDGEGLRVILLLDATKAFDSLEWQNLWWVLAGFQFGLTFINWIKMLYKMPESKVRVDNEYFDKF